MSTYSVAEQEAIGLCIGLEAINGMVNHEIFKLYPLEQPLGQAEVRYNSRAHQGLFLARLLDFVKEKGSGTLSGVNGSCLDVLEAACRTRSFDYKGSVVDLVDATAALRTWLEARTKFTLWLPTLDINAKLEARRLDYLFISGNQAKHNLSRLTGVSKHVAAILRDHGYNPPLELIPLALDDFQVHLNEHYFVYYGTWLAELLNNVRWGLQEYLQVEFARSYSRKPDELEYRYTFPPDITDAVAREWYWRLMNHVRARPYVGRFAGADYMRRESLEREDIF